MAKPQTQYNSVPKAPTSFLANRPVSDGQLLIGEGAFLLVSGGDRLALSVGVIDKPPTSFDKVAKNPTAVQAIAKPVTSWATGEGLEGIRLDDMEITLDDMDVFLTGYRVYPTPNILSTKNPTEYSEV